MLIRPDSVSANAEQHSLDQRTCSVELLFGNRPLVCPMSIHDVFFILRAFY